MAKATRVRWTAEEWAVVMIHAMPLIDGGMHKVEALRKAQRLALPKSRHRPNESLAKSCTPSTGTFDAARAVYRKLSPQQREGLRSQSATPTPPPLPETPAKGDGSRKVWTTRESAIVARKAEALKDDPKHAGRSLSGRYLLAQVLCLPVDRHRSKSALYSAVTTGHLQKQHAAGLAHAWQYPDTEEVQAAAPGQAQAAQEGPAAALGAPSDAAMAAAQMAYVSTTLRALDELLAVRDAHLAAQMSQNLAEAAAVQYARVGQTMQDLLKVQLDVITQRVAESLRTVLLEELGGSSKPATAAAPAPAAATNGHAGTSMAAPKTNGMRFDIIGTIDEDWRKRIRDAVSDGDELRFIQPEQASDFSPHTGHTIIWMQHGRLPRVLQKKLETVKIKPMLVRNAAGHVLRAIEDIKRTSVVLQ